MTVLVAKVIASVASEKKIAKVPTITWTFRQLLGWWGDAKLLLAGVKTRPRQTFLLTFAGGDPKLLGGVKPRHPRHQIAPCWQLHPKS